MLICKHPSKPVAIGWKRTLKATNLQPHLQAECDKLVGWFPNVKFHGEFFKRGVSINVTAGIYNHKTFTSDMHAMEYHVFDIADDTKPQRERVADKEAIFADSRVKALKYIKQVKSVFYPAGTLTPEALDKFYKKALADDYEGIVIRDANAKYKYCAKNYHVSHAFKYKPIYDREFECINFDQCDKGKAVGCIKFICRIAPDGEFGERTFTVRPKGMTEPESKAEFIRLSSIAANGKTVFENDFKGKPYQVEFDEYSDEGKPLKGYGLRFRLTLD
jgi:ATP-dependent DNA ligase